MLKGTLMLNVTFKFQGHHVITNKREAYEYTGAGFGAKQR